MRGLWKISLVVLLAGFQVALAGTPTDFTFLSVDSMAGSTTSITSASQANALASLSNGTPISDPSIGWANVSTSSQVFDLTDPLYQGSRVQITGSVTGVNHNGSWMTIGLLDKHYIDGLAIGNDPAAEYASSQYGFGMNGGITIIGGAEADNNNLRIKAEDGYDGVGGQSWAPEVGAGGFDFKIRYNFYKAAYQEFAEIEVWWRATGAADDEWQDLYCTLGQPTNADFDYTAYPEVDDRYKEDQWDQAMMGVMIVNDGIDGLPGSITVSDLEMSIQVNDGDADLDTDVDADDLATWGANYTGPTGSGKVWGNGDFDQDGDVDADDLATWGANYTGAIGGGSMTAVPEPVTMSLLALGGAALVRRRRK